MCQNELLMIEHNDVQNQLKLQGVKSLFTALENVDEAVEITNADHEIQVSQSVRKLPVTWGWAVVFARNSGLLHQLQLASHDSAAIWQKK